MALNLRRCTLLVLTVAVLGLAEARAYQPDEDPSALLDRAQATLVSNAQSGFDLARQAKGLELQSEAPRNEVLLRAAWLEAEGLFRLRRLDEAADVISASLDTFDNQQSEIYGKLLIASGRVARARGDDGLALESFQNAFKVFSALGNTRYMAISLQSIGTLYMNAKQYERAIEYDQRAVETHPDDPVILLVSLNNRANALRRLDRQDEARKLLHEALSQEIVGSAPNYAVRLQANLAALELSVGNIDAAKTSVAAIRGLEAKIPKDQMPLLPFAVDAKIALLEGRDEAARRILDRTFANTDFETTPEDETEAHALAFEVYDRLGLADSALLHLKALKRLEDAERDVAASANLAITNAEFELSTKELTIEKLRTERLEADVELIRAKRAQDRMFYGAIVVAAVSVICFLVWQTWQSGRVRRITEALNRQLEAVNLKLRRSNVDLEKANSAKTEFLATTSHEIRTPLNAVINLTADVLEHSDLSPPEQEKLSTALRSAEHLHEIVSDVLDVARFEGRRVTTHLSDVRIQNVVDDVVNLWRPKAEEKGLAFGASIDLADSLFHTDEKLIRQVLSNLLSNAIKFTPHGRIELSASGGSATRPLTVSVSDSGIGIAKENRDIIFESFRQIDTGGTRSFQGTGLGLAICKQITELLGGKIDVKSEVGFGTTFTVTIPMSERAQAELEPIPVPEPPIDVDITLGRLRVLAAEDNAVNAMVIQAILKGKVETLTIVENGQLAVDAVSVGDFDMVLMDKQMPVMDGVEATRRIRALPGHRSTIPIVAVTADAFAAAREELLAAGADDYLSKPVKPEDLKRAIAAAVRAERAKEDTPRETTGDAAS